MNSDRTKEDSSEGDLALSRDSTLIGSDQRATRSSSAEEFIDLIAALDVIKARWSIVALTLVLAIGVAVAIALFLPSIYRSSVLLAPVSSDPGQGGLASLGSQFGGLATLVGVTVSDQSDLETRIATIQSRRFLLSFVDDNNLKPVLFEEEWDGHNKTWRKDEAGVLGWIFNIWRKESDPGETLEPSSNDVYRLLREDVLQVEHDSRTGLVTLTIDWTDPVVAAKWANQLVDRANQELREAAIEESEKSIRYLSEQAAATNIADLRAVLYRLIEEHTKNMMLARTQPEYAFRIIDPAVPADLDDEHSPKRILIIFVGMLVGGGLGIAATFIIAAVKKPNGARANTTAS